MPDPNIETVTQGIAQDIGSGQTSQGAGDVTPTTTTSQLQQPSREAFFQQNWDKLSSSLKEFGVELKPDVDFKQVFEPYIKSHQLIQSIDRDPETLFNTLAEVYPDRIVRPDYSKIVKDTLDREFGPEFIPDDHESLMPGTPSWKYRTRGDQIIQEHNMKQMRERMAQEQQAVENQRVARESFQKQYSQAKEELKLDDDTMKKYVEKLTDPNYFTLSNVIKIIMLHEGALEYVPLEEGETIMPPSTGSISGTGVQPAKRFLADVF
jgi:hypothetical protein